ncbi:MAG: hypothetical protein K2M99_08745 [Treponemataceae bacterium]|nr:hypothetical protein [Treponemataceae bacterium]
MLKKWGKYFAKGAKVGLMAAMLATTSCGNQMSDDDGVTYVAEDKFGINSDFEFEQDLKADIFNRHRFAPKNGTFKNLSHDEISMFGWHLYKHAEKYLTNELAEFNKAMQKESNATFRNLAQRMAKNNAFAKSGIRTIDSAIAQNNNECAELFANMIYPLEARSRTEFMACYDYLANRAYNDSLGQKAGTMSRANSDLAETKQKLQNLGIATNDHAVESKLYSFLTPMSERTGVSVNTLQRGINLALCTDGMHGARDLGGSAEALSHDPVYVPPGTFQSKLGNWSGVNFDACVASEIRLLVNKEQSQTLGR